jgi:hypothetical protein
MKTTRILALLLFVSISIFVIISCQKNDLAKTDPSENVSGKAPTNVMPEVIPTIPLPDCNTECINPEGPYIEATGSQTEYWGNSSNPHSKTVSYVVYNTDISFVVKVTFVHSGGNASNTISVTTALGEPQSVETLASGATATFTFALPADWEKCDNVPFTIRQEGQSAPINISASYSLYGICVNRGCETSFTGKAISCGNQREAVYTFTSQEALTGFKIQGGLTNFTGDDAVVTVTHGSNITPWQGTQGGSSNRLIKVEGNIAACETIKICIKWNSTNSGGVITGSWSVKANGTDVAPAVAGLTCE